MGDESEAMIEQMQEIHDTRTGRPHFLEQKAERHARQRGLMAEIHEAYRTDPAFNQLRTHGIVLVPGEGASQPSVFIVGEAPGAVENTRKRPFVGASGEVLRSLIKNTAEIPPNKHFITNVVKYRPPNNRTPHPAEVRASLPYLRREFAAVGSPAVLVAVGGTAFNALKNAGTGGILAAAGKPMTIKGGRALWPMIHPAYGLRNPAARPTMEEHWEALGKYLREEGLI